MINWLIDWMIDRLIDCSFRSSRILRLKLGSASICFVIYTHIYRTFRKLFLNVKPTAGPIPPQRQNHRPGMFRAGFFRRKITHTDSHTFHWPCNFFICLLNPQNALSACRSFTKLSRIQLSSLHRQALRKIIGHEQALPLYQYICPGIHPSCISLCVITWVTYRLLLRYRQVIRSAKRRRLPRLPRHCVCVCGRSGRSGRSDAFM